MNPGDRYDVRIKLGAPPKAFNDSRVCLVWLKKSALVNSYYYGHMHTIGDPIAVFCHPDGLKTTFGLVNIHRVHVAKYAVLRLRS